MPRVNVNGIGVLNFPDNMSRDDIKIAIKNHPDYKAPRQQGSIEQRISNYLGSMTKFIKNNQLPGFETMDRIGEQVFKGVPVIGEFGVDSPKTVQFEQNHPYVTTGARLSGGVASMLPFSAGVLAATGSKLLPAALGQAGLFGSTGVADVVAEKGPSNITTEEMINTFILNALAGAGGTLLGRFITPNYTPKETYKPLLMVGKKGGEEVTNETINTFRQMGMSMDEITTLIEKANITRAKGNIEIPKKMAARHEAKIEALKQNAPDIVKNIPAYAVGGAVGHLVAGWPGAMVGAATAPYLKEGAKETGKRWWANQMLSPQNQLRLQALIGSSPTSDIAQ